MNRTTMKVGTHTLFVSKLRWTVYTHKSQTNRRKGMENKNDSLFFMIGLIIFQTRKASKKRLSSGLYSIKIVVFQVYLLGLNVFCAQNKNDVSQNVTWKRKHLLADYRYLLNWWTWYAMHFDSTAIRYCQLQPILMTSNCYKNFHSFLNDLPSSFSTMKTFPVELIFF